MLIFADKRMPEQALQNLSEYGQLVPFSTEHIVYDSISGHTDIFLITLNKQLITAPNLPEYYKELMLRAGINFIEGQFPVGAEYPQTAGYNAVFCDNKLFHNFRYTDPSITGIAQDSELIHINQGYARCSIIPLGNNKYITSDKGVESTLKRYALDVLYVDPSAIVLPGQKHGFIGGCCGIHKEKLFFTGSLNKIKDGELLRTFCTASGYKVVELSDEALFDGGSILFAE